MVELPQTNHDILVFDRNLIKTRRERCAKRFSDHDFLFQWGCDQIHDRLMDVNRTFDTALHIGARCPVSEAHQKIQKLFITDLTATSSYSPFHLQSSEELLPVAPQSLDLVTSNLTLHSVNDLPGALLQIRQALKEDGLFIASLFGGETLYELRDVMTQAEISLYGGISPRISPFADKPQMGDLLFRAGYSLPVIDSEIITVTYDNIFKLLHDIKGMGESNTILDRSKAPTSKEFFMKTAQLYQDKYAQNDGRIVASFEVIFLLGWAPHASQQKPLRPGSAKNSLAEALGTKEIKTGE